MTMLMLKTAEASAATKAGLLFRDLTGGLLAEGRHWFLDPLGKFAVQVVSKRDPWLVDEKLERDRQVGWSWRVTRR